MIREFIVEDLPVINNIGTQISENFVEKNNVINIKNLDYAKLFVYDDNIVKGFIYIEDHIDYIDIIDIAVDSNYKRAGIASKLIDYVISFNKRIVLEVRESNIPAIGLYTKYGFKTINTRKKYYGNEDAIVMERSI